MAHVSFKQTTSTKVPLSAANHLPFVEGQLIFVTDTRKLMYDYIDGNSAQSRIPLGGEELIAGLGIDITNGTISLDQPIFIGTTQEWTSEQNKSQYVQVILTDDSDGDTPLQAGNGITISDNRINVVTPYRKIFVGTSGDWEALSDIDKAQYELVSITDDNGDISPVSGKNLFDNWYFIGGVNRTFPIDQRGGQVCLPTAPLWLNGSDTGTTAGDYYVATYPGSGDWYTVNIGGVDYAVWKDFVQRGYISNYSKLMDRWDKSSGIAVLLNADGIKISANSQFAYFQQLFEEDALPTDRPLTLSVLTSNNLYSWTFYLTKEGWQPVPYEETFYPYVGWDSDKHLWRICPAVNADNSGATHTAIIKAVKLEVGSRQTLAYNVGTSANPNWKLIDPVPNYGEELAKCQRYLLVFTTKSYEVALIANGYGQNATSYRFSLPTPVTMAKRPASPASFANVDIVAAHGPIGKANVTRIDPYWGVSPNSINLIVTVTSGGVAHEAATLCLTNSATLVLDANL